MEQDLDDFPLPQPRLPVARGAEREALRQKLLRDLSFALQGLQSARDLRVEEYERPLTDIERDAAMADLPRQAELMRREEQSCVREFWRLGNSLRKLQERAARDAEDVGPNGARPGTSAAGPYGNHTQNEGAPGDVAENTAPTKIDSMTDCRESAAEGQFQDGIPVKPATDGDVQVAKEGEKPKSEPAKRAARLASAA